MGLPDILADHPDKTTFDLAELTRAAQAAMECALACSACADSDLGRDPSSMATCIRTCTDCADMCTVTAKMLARPAPRGDAWQKVVMACVALCAQCADECGKHDDLCCRECADACRACEQACQQLIAVAQK